MVESACKPIRLRGSCAVGYKAGEWKNFTHNSLGKTTCPWPTVVFIIFPRRKELLSHHEVKHQSHKSPPLEHDDELGGTLRSDGLWIRDLA